MTSLNRKALETFTAKFTPEPRYALHMWDALWREIVVFGQCKGRIYIQNRYLILLRHSEGLVENG